MLIGSLFAWSPTNIQDINEGLHNKHISHNTQLLSGINGGDVDDDDNNVVKVKKRQMLEKGCEAHTRNNYI